MEDHKQVEQSFPTSKGWFGEGRSLTDVISITKLRKRLLSISPEEATIARRGFRDSGLAVKTRLERVGQSFLEGYHASLDDAGLPALESSLSVVDLEFRGFAYEGAAMGLTILDSLSLKRKERLKEYLEGPGSAHIYMAHVGAGWALARLPWRMGRLLHRLDPLLRWLVIDGFGFHEGYFNWRKQLSKQTVPGMLTGYARRVFDQGLGRSLWFSQGTDVSQIASTIASFSENRRSDLWSGTGLACAYAGGGDQDKIKQLLAVAAPYRGHLAQGAAFAAKARQRADNLMPHTQIACEIICELSAPQAAAITDAALEELDGQGDVPDYEIWRRRIRTQIEKNWR